MIREYAAASLTGSWRGVPGRLRDVVDDQPGAVRRDHVLELGELLGAEVLRRPAPCGPGRSGACSASTAQVVGRAEPGRLPRLGGEVEHHDHPGVGADQRLAQRGDQQVRDHRGEPRAGAEHHPVGGLDRLERLGRGRRVGRHQRDRVDDPVGGGHLDLAADAHEGVGVVGHQPAHVGGDVHRHQRHRQHPTGGAEQPADVVERVDVVAEQLPEPDDEQVADHVVAHLAVAGEPVLEHPRPGHAPLVAPAERRQRHPQVARGQHAELAAQPTRRAAVVGDGDDRGEVVDHELVDQQPQRRQRGVQPVAAAEGDDGHRPVGRQLIGHPHPITPCPGRGGTRGPRSPRPCRRRTTSSVTVTLRCLPPVQPIATCANRLPWRR